MNSLIRIILIAELIASGSCIMDVGDRFISHGVPNAKKGKSGTDDNIDVDGMKLTGEIQKFDRETISQDLLGNTAINKDLLEERVYVNESPNPMSKSFAYKQVFKEVSELTYTKRTKEFLEICEKVTTDRSVNLGWILKISVGKDKKTTITKETIVDSHQTQRIFREEERTFTDNTSFTVHGFQKLRVDAYVEVVRGKKLHYTATVRVSGTKRNGDKATAREIRAAVMRKNSNANELTWGEHWIEYEIDGYIIASFGLKAKTVLTEIRDPTSSTTTSTTGIELTRTDFTITSETPANDDRLAEPAIGESSGSMAAIQWIVGALIVCIALYGITKAILKYNYRAGERTESIPYDIPVPMKAGLDF